jgi:hypothetical protein
MSVFTTLISGIASGTAHNLAQSGPFSLSGLKESKVSDENATSESDATVVKVLNDKKYSSDSIKRRNETFDLDSIVNSGAFSVIDHLSTAARNLKKLTELYNSSNEPEQKKAYEAEIGAITEEFNASLKSDTFKKFDEITTSLASRQSISIKSNGLKKSLGDNLSLIGPNYLDQASRGNLNYFKNLSQGLDGLKSLNLSAQFVHGKVLISAGSDSGIVSDDNAVVLDRVLDRTDSTLSSFLKGSSLEGVLDKSIEDFRKLQKITESSEGGSLDLAQGLRTNILMNPEKGVAAQAFLSPLIAMYRLY